VRGGRARPRNAPGSGGAGGGETRAWGTDGGHRCAGDSGAFQGEQARSCCCFRPSRRWYRMAPRRALQTAESASAHCAFLQTGLPFSEALNSRRPPIFPRTRLRHTKRTKLCHIVFSASTGKRVKRKARLSPAFTASSRTAPSLSKPQTTSPRSFAYRTPVSSVASAHARA